MSRQFRYRMTALALGGLLLGVPLLTNGTASADQLDGGVEGGRQVTFDGGGTFDLSCHSRPDVESMTVPAGSTVRVVNRTGHSAKLQLGTESKGTVPDDAATEVVFRRGVTRVTMTPDCTLGSDASPSVITVSPSPSATMPDPLPAPPGPTAVPPAADTPSNVPAQPMVAAAGPTLPDTMAPAQAPSRSIPSVNRFTPRSPATAAKTKVKPASSRTGGKAAPAFAGMPPGQQKTLFGGVPKLDVSEVTSASTPETAGAPEPVSAAAETVAAIQPLGDRQPIGLLAVVAMVCAAGVTVAAIRSFVSQRANQVNLA